MQQRWRLPLSGRLWQLIPTQVRVESRDCEAPRARTNFLPNPLRNVRVVLGPPQYGLPERPDLAVSCHHLRNHRNPSFLDLSKESTGMSSSEVPAWGDPSTTLTKCAENSFSVRTRRGSTGPCACPPPPCGTTYGTTASPDSPPPCEYQGHQVGRPGQKPLLKTTPRTTSAASNQPPNYLSNAQPTAEPSPQRPPKRRTTSPTPNQPQNQAPNAQPSAELHPRRRTNRRTKPQTPNQPPN